MKIIKTPGASREISVRMTPLSADIDITKSPENPAECIPNIEGLFFWDTLYCNWGNLTNKILSDSTGGWPNQFVKSCLPIKLQGETCNLPVTWRTEWTVAESGGGDVDIYFEGENILGILIWDVNPWTQEGSMVEFHFKPKNGVMKVWATVNNIEYGPVTLTIDYSYIYENAYFTL
jgi:hypothetical protein